VSAHVLILPGDVWLVDSFTFQTAISENFRQYLISGKCTTYRYSTSTVAPEVPSPNVLANDIRWMGCGLTESPLATGPYKLSLTPWVYNGVGKNSIGWAAMQYTHAKI